MSREPADIARIAELELQLGVALEALGLALLEHNKLLALAVGGERIAGESIMRAHEGKPGWGA